MVGVNKWRLLAVVACLFLHIYCRNISKDPPFRSGKTECFLLGLLKVNLKTFDEKVWQRMVRGLHLLPGFIDFLEI